MDEETKDLNVSESFVTNEESSVQNEVEWKLLLNYLPIYGWNYKIYIYIRQHQETHSNITTKRNWH